VNCILVGSLIALAVQEYPKIEELEQQVEEDQKEVAVLEDEVRDKQQGQIQALNQQVQEEQEFNFLTLAGTFTLLTCLISLFHISSHLQKMNQPRIQRKIIAILWMSPIYSVTSFFTLAFPGIGGWMAIIKDFYEAYCIYTFLSFLIAVLGHGSREEAVNVLSRHASHLEQPTRCLSCFYEPPPDTSDHAEL
jgi:membrane-associated HD superfamily phosphohydrolase